MQSVLLLRQKGWPRPGQDASARILLFAARQLSHFLQGSYSTASYFTPRRAATTVASSSNPSHPSCPSTSDIASPSKPQLSHQQHAPSPKELLSTLRKFAAMSYAKRPDSDPLPPDVASDGLRVAAGEKLLLSAQAGDAIQFSCTACGACCKSFSDTVLLEPLDVFVMSLAPSVQPGMLQRAPGAAAGIPAAAASTGTSSTADTRAATVSVNGSATLLPSSMGPVASAALQGKHSVHNVTSVKPLAFRSALGAFTSRTCPGWQELASRVAERSAPAAAPADSSAASLLRSSPLSTQQGAVSTLAGDTALQERGGDEWAALRILSELRPSSAQLDMSDLGLAEEQPASLASILAAGSDTMDTVDGRMASSAAMDAGGSAPAFSATIGHAPLLFLRSLPASSLAPAAASAAQKAEKRASAEKSSGSTNSTNNAPASDKALEEHLQPPNAEDERVCPFAVSHPRLLQPIMKGGEGAQRGRGGEEQGPGAAAGAAVAPSSPAAAAQQRGGRGKSSGMEEASVDKERRQAAVHRLEGLQAEETHGHGAATGAADSIDATLAAAIQDPAAFHFRPQPAFPASTAALSTSSSSSSSPSPSHSQLLSSSGLRCGLGPAHMPTACAYYPLGELWSSSMSVVGEGEGGKSSGGTTSSASTVSSTSEGASHFYSLDAGWCEGILDVSVPTGQHPYLSKQEVGSRGGSEQVGSSAQLQGEQQPQQPCSVAEQTILQRRQLKELTPAGAGGKAASNSDAEVPWVSVSDYVSPPAVSKHDPSAHAVAPSSASRPSSAAPATRKHAPSHRSLSLAERRYWGDCFRRLATATASLQLDQRLEAAVQAFELALLNSLPAAAAAVPSFAPSPSAGGGAAAAVHPPDALNSLLPLLGDGPILLLQEAYTAAAGPVAAEGESELSADAPAATAAASLASAPARRGRVRSSGKERSLKQDGRSSASHSSSSPPPPSAAQLASELYLSSLRRSWYHFDVVAEDVDEWRAVWQGVQQRTFSTCQQTSQLCSRLQAATEALWLRRVQERQEEVAGAQLRTQQQGSSGSISGSGAGAQGRRDRAGRGRYVSRQEASASAAAAADDQGHASGSAKSSAERPFLPTISAQKRRQLAARFSEGWVRQVLEEGGGGLTAAGGASASH